jgi:hypothetical protein
MAALAFVWAVATICTANAGYVDDALQQQKAEREKQLDQIGKLMKPLADCVKKQAHSNELYSLPEKADVVARAAVGLCSKQEGALRSAFHQLALVSGIDASKHAQETHDELVEMALTIIVKERQRQRAEPSAKDQSETQHFKNGCTDFVAGRATEDALNCVAVLDTAMQLVIIFQNSGKLNICIPKDDDRLVKDYVKLINQHPDLVNDNEPISVGLLRVLAREFPCDR